MNNQTGAFRTHQHYLEAFAYLAANENRFPRDAYVDIKERFKQNRITTRIPQNTINREQLKRALENAWGTELLLLMSHKFVREDEIIRLSNNWNVIQAYYAIYHATQALIVGKGIERPESHTKTQKLYVDIWGRLPIDFAPWSLTMGADGCSINDLMIDPSIHQWTSVNSGTCWSIACKALQSTRTDAIYEYCKIAREDKRKTLRKDWKQKHSGKTIKPKEPEFRLPRLTAGEKTQIDQQTRHYSIMDYFYRLRIRCNYVDSSMFADGPEEPHDSIGVRVAIIKIVSTTLFATEIMLCSTKEGITLLSDWADKWAKKSVPQEMKFGVGGRINLWK
jgi:hypothetical protein